jgi:hypothetical protein
MLGRGMSQIDYALAQDDKAGGTIGEIGISCCRAKPQLLRRNKRSAFAASLRSCPACAAGGVAAVAKRGRNDEKCGIVDMLDAARSLHEAATATLNKALRANEC